MGFLGPRRGGVQISVETLTTRLLDGLEAARWPHLHAIAATSSPWLRLRERVATMPSPRRGQKLRTRGPRPSA